MKNRLKALDGLRGLAAFSVFLSHSGFAFGSLIGIVFLQSIYRAFSVGPNSVQIFFVLSGFLMAYLYPIITKPIVFIQKRYGRIMPILIAVILFSWLAENKYSIFIEIKFLLFIALSFNIIWNILDHYFGRFRPGQILFYFLLFSQLILILIGLLIIPHYIVGGNLILSKKLENILVFLFNATLTSPFAQGINGLSGVTWSLGTEMIFYIIYPFLVLPLIRLGKKYGTWFSIFITISVIKILFDLDNVFLSNANLSSLSVARASGFLVGVIVGTIYQNKGNLWKKSEKIFSRSTTNLIVLLLFFLVQWGDWAIRDGSSHYFMNWYYFISSIVFGLVIIAGIIPNTWINKIFSNRVLGFFGLISYSMYLIHSITIGWVKKFLDPIITIKNVYELTSLFFSILLTVVISYILYYLVENLYFKAKKTNSKSFHENITSKQESKIFSNPKKLLISTIIVLLIFMFIYMEGYSYSILLTRQSFFQKKWQINNEISLLNNKISVPFIAKYNNLGMVVINIRYEKDAARTMFNEKKQPAQIIFKLFDENNQKIFESKKNAYLAAGNPHFPFGFPPQKNSAGKKYRVELQLTGGTKIDQVFVDTGKGMITGSLISKKELFSNPFKLLFNRLFFVFSNSSFIFILIFICLCFLGLIAQ